MTTEDKQKAFWKTHLGIGLALIIFAVAMFSFGLYGYGGLISCNTSRLDFTCLLHALFWLVVIDLFALIVLWAGVFVGPKKTAWRVTTVLLAIVASAPFLIAGFVYLEFLVR